MRSKTLLGLIAAAISCGCPHTDSVPIVSKVEGRVSAIGTQPGAQIHTGDILLQLDTHDLVVKRDNLIARIDVAELRQTDASSLYRELRSVNRDLSRLTITAPADGRVIWISPLRPGDEVHGGQTIALLLLLSGIR